MCEINGEIRISAVKNKNSVKFFNNYRKTNNGLEEQEKRIRGVVVISIYKIIIYIFEINLTIRN